MLRYSSSGPSYPVLTSDSLVMREFSFGHLEWFWVFGCQVPNDFDCDISFENPAAAS